VTLLRKSVLLLLSGLAFFFLAGVVAVWAPDKPLEELKARWAQPPSRFLVADGVLVHLRDEGPRDDPLPIVLLHGTSDSLHTWDGWVSGLSGGRRVVRFDLPGFGLTGPNPENDYSMRRYMQFVGAVLDRLGIEQHVLVGNSLGGHIAWEFAASSPGRVRALVLVDAGGYEFESQEVPLAFRLVRQPVLRHAFDHVLPRGLVQSSVRNVYGDPAKATPELVDRYYDMALRAGNRRALAHRMDTRLAGDPQRIRALKIPTLILWGGRDRLIPVASGRQFERDIAGSKLVVFAELGHLPQQEDPLGTLVELRRFLKGL
jgi:pimeloyl-ACP methyl ester carboxylesterase